MSKLSAKHDRFCREYVKDLNATQAYIRAGYSEKGASKNSSRLMANDGIKPRVRELQDEINKSLHLSASETIRNVSLMANFDIGDYYNDDFSLKPLQEMSREVRTSIVGVEMTSIQIAKNVYNEVMTYKLADKSKSNDMMMKHHALYTAKVEVSGELNLSDFVKRHHESKQ